MAIIPFTDDELAGMAVYSELVRSEVSGSYSPLGPNQRAELVRLSAEAFSVGPRAPMTWFTLGTERRQMLRANVPPDDLIARIIFAKCLVGSDTISGPRRQFERVAPSGSTDSYSYSLRDMVYGPTVGGQIFHWEFSGYGFNIFRSETPSEKIALFLQWEYEYYAIPSWVPTSLRPYNGADPAPF